MNTALYATANGSTSRPGATGTPGDFLSIRRRFAFKPLFIRTVMRFAISGLLAGCAMIGQPEPSIPAVSIEPLEYYTGEVKGYQKSYPDAHVLVLPPVDRRQLPVFKDRSDIGLGVPGDGAEVGVISDQNGSIVQRIYAPPVEPMVQSALSKSAKEAGLTPEVSNEALESALRQVHEDYVLASQVTNCWVVKRPVKNLEGDTIWVTEAVFALAVQVYKPPFQVAFWHGNGAVDYSDPTLGYDGMAFIDSVAMYDRPGQVLSVALTRAVAAIFANDKLQELVTEDSNMRGQRSGL